MMVLLATGQSCGRPAWLLFGLALCVYRPAADEELATLLRLPRRKQRIAVARPGNAAQVAVHPRRLRRIQQTQILAIQHVDGSGVLKTQRNAPAIRRETGGKGLLATGGGALGQQLQTIAFPAVQPHLAVKLVVTKHERTRKISDLQEFRESPKW
jgi:hypothetical protein